MIEAFERWKEDRTDEELFEEFFEDEMCCLDTRERVSAVALEVYKLSRVLFASMEGYTKALQDWAILNEKRIELLEEKLGEK